EAGKPVRKFCEDRLQIAQFHCQSIYLYRHISKYSFTLSIPRNFVETEAEEEARSDVKPVFQNSRTNRIRDTAIPTTITNRRTTTPPTRLARPTAPQPPIAEP